MTGQDFKTTPALATLVNGAASHALENDDIATFSSHPNSPLTAATLALGEKLGVSGRDFVLGVGGRLGDHGADDEGRPSARSATS